MPVRKRKGKRVKAKAKATTTAEHSQAGEEKLATRVQPKSKQQKQKQKLTTKAELQARVEELEKRLAHVQTHEGSWVHQLFCFRKRTYDPVVCVEDTELTRQEEQHGEDDDISIETGGTRIRWGLVLALIASLVFLLAHTEAEFDNTLLDDDNHENVFADYIPTLTLKQPTVPTIPPEIKRTLDHITENYLGEGQRRPGTLMREQGFEKHYPVVLIPGIVSTALEVWRGETCAMKQHFRQRFWGSGVMLKQIVMDSQCWMKHMMLNHTTGLDPDGIKLRPATGLAAADYLVGNFWVWAKLIENLADLGYDENSMWLAGYDWRLSYTALEQRDYFYSKLQGTIEIAVQTNGAKAVLLSHSMGGVVLHAFMQWVTLKDAMWVDTHVEAIMNIGVPLLGAPKTISSVFSGEMKDTAELGDWLDSLRKTMFSEGDVVSAMRSFRSVAGLFPKGGDAIWSHQAAGDHLNNNDDGELDVSSSGIKDLSPISMITMTDTGASLGMEETFDVLRAEATLYMQGIDEEYSTGVASEKQMRTQAFANDQRHWANPLETMLPNAPDLKVYCLYGIGLETERAYHYARHIPIGPVSEQTHVNEAYRRISHKINKTVHDGNARNGVVMTDGDGTVPLVSLGFMCAQNGAWSSPKYNPSGAAVVIREYVDKNQTFADKLLRPASSVDHVDLMGNNELITDILSVVGRKRNITDADNKTHQSEDTELATGTPDDIPVDVITGRLEALVHSKQDEYELFKLLPRVLSDIEERAAAIDNIYD